MVKKARALNLPGVSVGWGLTPPQSDNLGPGERFGFIAAALIARVDAATREILAIIYIPGQQRVDALAAHLEPALRTPEAVHPLALGAAEKAGQDT